jgi:NADP-dependent 3-hydroxy acid dehydrogenase YdfG
MTQNIEGKVVVITGASTRLGEATAWHLAAAGAKLVLGAAALPHMTRQKSGHIINVSSVAGHKVRPGSAVYAATKAAVRLA